MIVGLDFDGTVVHSEYPKIGRPALPGALAVLHRLQSRGDKIILWTIRSGAELAAAVKYLERHGIQLWGINENPDQQSWSPSPKAHCDVYIDDKAIGCPLVQVGGGRPYVDWMRVLRTFCFLSYRS